MLLCGTRVGQVTQVIGPFKMATSLRTNSSNIPEMGNLNSRMRRISFLMRTAKSCNLQRVQKLCELFFFRQEKSASKYFFSVGFVTVLVCGKCAITDVIRLKPLNILFSRGDG